MRDKVGLPGIDQLVLRHPTLSVLLDGARQMGGIGRRFQQMDRLHQAVEGIERHDHRIGRIPPNNDRVVDIVDDLIDDVVEAVASLGKIDNPHGSLQLVLFAVRL
jgi:hypothetical protein